MITSFNLNKKTRNAYVNSEKNDFECHSGQLKGTEVIAFDVKWDEDFKRNTTVTVPARSVVIFNNSDIIYSKCHG